MWRLGIVAVILLAASSDLLNRIHARKLVHLGCGLTLAHINMPGPDLRNAILFISVGSIFLFRTSPLRFGAKNDVGITWYNIVVFAFVLLNLPLRLLLPVFVIDPVACVVGMSIQSRRWHGNKTVAGTIAALIASYITLYYVKHPDHRFILTLILPLTEGLMENHDNLGISMVVICYFWLARQNGWPIDFYHSLVD